MVESSHCQFICFDAAREADRKTVELIREAWDAEAAEEPGFEFKVRELLSKIILRLREDAVGKEYVMTDAEIRDAERLKLMLKYIEEHFDEEITLSEIAASAALSESACQRCFRRGRARCTPANS